MSGAVLSAEPLLPAGVTVRTLRRGDETDLRELCGLVVPAVGV